ncbi:hypothetical protein F4820DRAFT_232075 [Hypoxylon rubiginosum]|uniref:Uncharacterized protein n=1 Tax=Hypoxylon rubiginosum TaxID=110542 RepID=A0ACB9Z6L9_9PEZI|nr:hypothetical protein F4820DRAFT_232075 [Hypoxylon rubiginosum]
MWFRPLAALILLGSIVSAQDDLPQPGEPALQYTDGAFTEPRGSQSTYNLGTTLNVSWHTTYDTSNLWLIVGWKFNEPIQLATNIGQTWYEWEVSTDSTNTTEVYSFRVVNATGTEEQQQGGGFLSATFYIGNLKASTSSISSTASHVSTSASAPAATSEAAVTSSSVGPAITTDSTVASTAGLSEGGKIGVGVGVGVGGVGIIALIAGILLYRRSKNNKTKAADGMEPYSQTPQTFPSTPQTYAGTPGPQSYNEYYKPATGPSEMENTAVSAELPGNGSGFAHQGYAYPGNNQGSHRVELQG